MRAMKGLFWGAVGVVLLGCDGPTAPPPVDEVAITPTSTALELGEAARLTATPVDAAGRPLEGREILWSSSDPSVAEVSEDGWVTGRLLGSATIRAESEGKVGVAEVTVVVSFVSLSAGLGSTCGLSRTGMALCWSSASPTPVPVPGGLRFRSISSGGSHACGIATDSTAYCWGSNDGGQLGDGSTEDSAVPRPVAGALRFLAIDAGWLHTCGIATDRSAYCWGITSTSGLDDSRVPVAVSGGHQFGSIRAGADFSCGLTTSGTPLCWGDNNWAQLGTGEASESSSSPVEVNTSLTFTSIEASFHGYTCAPTGDPVLYCWGHNDAGQLGRGFTSSFEPTIEPVGEALPAVLVAAGALHACGVTGEGTAYCWGRNNGRLGDGTSAESLVPVQVVGGLRFALVTAGQGHTCGLTTDGIAYCWGGDALVPVRVPGSVPSAAAASASVHGGQ